MRPLHFALLRFGMISSSSSSSIASLLGAGVRRWVFEGTIGTHFFGNSVDDAGSLGTDADTLGVFLVKNAAKVF